MYICKPHGLFITLSPFPWRQGLSLNLELVWWSASSRKAPVYTPTPQHWGYGTCRAFYWAFSWGFEIRSSYLHRVPTHWAISQAQIVTCVSTEEVSSIHLLSPDFLKLSHLLAGKAFWHHQRKNEWLNITLLLPMDYLQLSWKLLTWKSHQNRLVFFFK